jgi:hypothetical protein
VAYLRERQPEAPTSPHKVEHIQDIRGIDAVARRRSTWRWQDAARFIEAQCLAADTGARYDFTDLHKRTLNPAP